MRDIIVILLFNRNELNPTQNGNSEDSHKSINNPCYNGWPLGYALPEVFPIHPAVLPFQGVGIERTGLKGRKSAMAKICQE